jgi:hypothetical protein
MGLIDKNIPGSSTDRDLWQKLCIHLVSFEEQLPSELTSFFEKAAPDIRTFDIWGGFTQRVGKLCDSVEAQSGAAAAIGRMMEFMEEQGIHIPTTGQVLLKKYLEFMLSTDGQSDVEPPAELAKFAKEVLFPAIGDKQLAIEAKAAELFDPLIAERRQGEAAAAAAAARPARRQPSWFETGSTSLSFAAATQERIAALQGQVAALTGPRRKAGTEGSIEGSSEEEMPGVKDLRLQRALTMAEIRKGRADKNAMVADLKNFAEEIRAGSAAAAEDARTPVREAHSSKREAVEEEAPPVDGSQSGSSTSRGSGTAEEQPPQAATEVDGGAKATKSKKRRPSAAQRKAAKKAAAAAGNGSTSTQKQQWKRKDSRS